ncbi:MAG: hypothetical protein ABSA21_07100, partial [Candidatus Limnocylindrales bacterium]
MPAIIATLQGWINGLVDTFGPLISDMADALPGAITTVEGFISGLLPSFGSGGAGGAATGLGKDISNLEKTFSTVFADIQVIVKGALGMLENFWKTFGGDIIGYLKIMVGMWEGIFNGVMEVIQGIFDVFAGLFSGDWSKVWTGVQEMFSGVMDAIGSIFQALLNLIPILLDAAGKVIGGIWGNIWHGLETAAQSIGNDISGAVQQYIVKPITDGFNSLVSFIAGVPGDITNAAAGMWDGIWQAFRSAINML